MNKKRFTSYYLYYKRFGWIPFYNQYYKNTITKPPEGTNNKTNLYCVNITSEPKSSTFAYLLYAKMGSTVGYVGISYIYNVLNFIIK